MATNALFTIDFSANYPIVQAKRAMFQALNYMGWGQFFKWTTGKSKKAVIPSGSYKGEAVSNSPIVAHRALAQKRGSKLEVPIFRQLKMIGKKGDEQLSGLEEDRKINFAHTYINTLRHGEKVKEGSLSAHIIKDYGIPESSNMALRNQFAQRMNFLEIPYAAYKGLNFSVLTDTGTFGSDANVAIVSHPNFFTVGGGRVASSGVYPGNAGYEAIIATAIDNIGITHFLSGGWLRALNADDQIRRIPYLYSKKGVPYRVFLVESYGMSQLRNDADVKAAQRSAFVQEFWKDNPELTGDKIFYEGWVILDFGHAIYPLQTSSSLPLYGPTATADTFTDLDDFNDYSAYTKFGGIVLGDNALAYASGWDMKWTGETRDHQEIKAVGYNIGCGASRPDFWNREDGSTGQYIINDTSAVVGYYAAKPSL